MKIDVLIMAAGGGTRMGADLPKQFMPLAGQPVLRRTYGVFAAHPAIRHVRVVIGTGQEALFSAAMANVPGLAAPILGGARRQDSVHLGLMAMAADPPDYVLIVDAARPLVDAPLISRVVAALSAESAVLTAIPAADTLKKQDLKQAITIDRKTIFQAQTPQAFPFAKILALHQSHDGSDITDDISLFEAAALPIQIVEGSRRNFKITTPEDLHMAEALLLAATENRIGHGYDVHRFCDGDHVWLGGVKIPHTQGVEAHSDGDVILHALTDALLGSIGAGDIGQHFPPSDPQWKDASSDQFVRHALRLLMDRGGQVVNADLTLLAEAPRIGPHRDAIVARVAELLQVPENRLNLKATTTEKLGFVGRREGLAAEAVVMVALPRG